MWGMGAGREGPHEEGAQGPSGASFGRLTPRGQPKALSAPQDVGVGVYSSEGRRDPGPGGRDRGRCAPQRICV